MVSKQFNKLFPKSSNLILGIFWRDVIFLIFSRWKNHYKHDHQKPITRVHSIPETVCKWAKLKGAGYASEPKNFLQVLAAHSLKPTASLPLKIGRSGQILVGNFIFHDFFRNFSLRELFGAKMQKTTTWGCPARRLGSIWLGSMGYN